MIYNYPYRKKKQQASKTWIITASSISNRTHRSFSAAFECDGAEYRILDVYIRLVGNPSSYYIKMIGSKTVEYNLLSSPLITFAEPPTGALLTWLQANAVEQ